MSNEQLIEVKHDSDELQADHQKRICEQAAYAWAHQALRHLDGQHVEQHVRQQLLDTVASAVMEANKRGAEAERDRCAAVVEETNSELIRLVHDAAAGRYASGNGRPYVDIQAVVDAVEHTALSIMAGIRGGK